ncbi:hypothetical protein [Marivivens marinus]|uniref:hypothetical protein n=1 Tax=Marivivens marinus TaxID=3110173 RepID=UPI003B84A942
MIAKRFIRKTCFAALYGALSFVGMLAVFAMLQAKEVIPSTQQLAEAGYVSPFVNSVVIGVGLFAWMTIVNLIEALYLYHQERTK